MILILNCPAIAGPPVCKDLFPVSSVGTEYFPTRFEPEANIDLQLARQFGRRVELCLRSGRTTEGCPMPEKFVFLKNLSELLHDKIAELQSLNHKIDMSNPHAQERLKKYQVALFKAERWGKQALHWIDKIDSKDSPLLTYGRVSEIEHTASRVLSFFESDLSEVLGDNKETNDFVDYFLQSARAPKFRAIGSIAIYRIWDRDDHQLPTTRESNIAFTENIFLGILSRKKFLLKGLHWVRPYELFDLDYKDTTLLVYVPTAPEGYLAQKKEFMENMNSDLEHIRETQGDRAAWIMNKFLFYLYRENGVYPTRIQLQTVRDDLEMIMLRERVMDKFINESALELEEPVTIQEYLSLLKDFFKRIDRYLGKWL